jgi:hypothetical protein
MPPPSPEPPSAWLLEIWELVMVTFGSERLLPVLPVLRIPPPTPLFLVSVPSAGFLLRKADFYSKTLKKDINIVKAHGTGTLSNNKAEKAALLNSGLSEFVATSYKQKIGHTLGASGLLETCLLLDDLKSGFVPEIKNRTEEDSVFLSKPEAKPDGLILSLAAGMGNIYAAAIFEDLS